MQYKINQQDNGTVIQINEARFDAKLAPEFRSLIESVIEDLNQNVILDLENVTFMDSSGLGAVMGVYKLLRDKQICVVNPQKAVMDLFKLTRMDRLIKTYNSLENVLTTAS